MVSMVPAPGGILAAFFCPWLDHGSGGGSAPNFSLPGFDHAPRTSGSLYPNNGNTFYALFLGAARIPV